MAVKDFNVEVQDKEFVVLVEPSGCGKTTTLRIIDGLEEPPTGNIFTVYDSLAFGLKIRKYPKQEIRQRVHEAAQILGIEHLLDREPKALSGGER